MTNVVLASVLVATQRISYFYICIFAALELRPGDALTYKRRADVRGKLSKRDEAIEDYKMAIVIQTSTKR